MRDNSKLLALSISSIEVPLGFIVIVSIFANCFPNSERLRYSQVRVR